MAQVGSVLLSDAGETTDSISPSLMTQMSSKVNKLHNDQHHLLLQGIGEGIPGQRNMHGSMDTLKGERKAFYVSHMTLSK